MTRTEASSPAQSPKDRSESREGLHTVVLSDLHLADAEIPPPENPLWKRFKHPDLFVDASLARLLEDLQDRVEGTIELVLNGDIFDFDSVMVIPESPGFHVSWLERRRGLNAEEPKSRFKIQRILDDHPVFVRALRSFVLNGNRVVFVIGNHDIEVHWPSVQREILVHLDLPGDLRKRVTFTEWFYISEGDTLIEHGCQYDAYCLCPTPVFPLIRKGSKRSVRLPFGNLAGRYMTNGMGLFNPHVESSFIMTWGEYLRFFFKYLIRIQPLLLWTWFWGAVTTLLVSIGEGLMPAYKNPLHLPRKIQAIADHSNATPPVVMSLRELHAHPAIFSPWMVLRELWLDRALLLLLLLVLSFQIFSVLNVFTDVSLWWFFVPFAMFLPAFIFYAQSVTSDVGRVQKTAVKRAPAAAKIAGVRRVVHGHTHKEAHSLYKGIEVLNNGTWSPAYHDVECTQPYGRKCFTWIRPTDSGHGTPGDGGEGRTSTLYEWKDPGMEVVPMTEMEQTPS
jgi:UDP-2,3-diacylglucosamine pyrophosphatase LpxH